MGVTSGSAALAEVCKHNSSMMPSAQSFGWTCIPIAVETLWVLGYRIHADQLYHATCQLDGQSSQENDGLFYTQI